MVRSPKISALLQKKYSGKTAISLNGKILAIGKNSIDAYQKAKRVMPGIEKKEFLVSHIYPKYVAA